MRNFTSYWPLALGCVVSFSLASCADEETVAELSLPKVLSFDAPEAFITAQQVTLKATVEHAQTVRYTYALNSEELPEASLWKEVEVSDSNTVEILLDSLQRLTPYKAAMLAEGKDGYSEIAQITFTTADVELKVSAAVVSEAESYNKAQLKVSVVNAAAFQWTYYPKDQRPADQDLVWTEVATTQGQNEYLVDVVDLEPSIDSRTIYTFEVKAVLEEKVSEPAYANFQTLATPALRIANFKVGSFMATYDMEIVKELCDGYTYLLQETAWYDVINFTDGATQWLPAITQNGFYEADIMLLTPERDYTFDMQALKIDTVANKRELLGERITEKFKTPAFSLNQSEDYTEIEVLAEKTGVTSITMNVNRSCSTTTAFLVGAVSKTDLGSTTIEEYINKTWYTPMCYPQSFKSMVGLMEEKEYNLTGLAPETEYIVFSIAIDTYGCVGKVKYAEAQTKAIVRNEEAFVESVAVNARFAEADITAVFGEGISRAFYQVAPKGELSAEDAQKQLEIESTASYSSYELWNESPTTLWDLSVDTDYDLYVLAVDSEGALGHVKLYEFSTLAPDFTSAVSLNASVDSIYVHESVKTWASVDLDIELVDGATSYYKAVLDREYLPQEEPTAEQYANYAITNNLLTETFTETALTVTAYSQNYTILFIPLDADRNMGAPVIISLKDHTWPEPEENPEEEGGGTPK